jgi:hypothetical protein
MIAIDWQQVIAYLLLGGSGIGGLIWGGKAAWTKFRSVAKSSEESKRSADAPAPAGAVEWAVDICAAMGDASAESKLTAILNGHTRDAARKFRITELEGKP